MADYNSGRKMRGRQRLRLRDGTSTVANHKKVNKRLTPSLQKGISQGSLLSLREIFCMLFWGVGLGAA